MSTVTPDQGIPLPQGTDLADVVASLISQTAALESRLNLRYLDLADRITRHPVAVEGQQSNLLTENRTDTYDGANWISATAHGYTALRRRTGDAAAINNNVGLVPDAVLIVPMVANATYWFGGRIYYDASTIADIKMALTWPAGTTNAKWGMIARDITTVTNLQMQVSAVSGTALAAGGNGVGTATFFDFDGSIEVGATAGNLQVQYAQNALDPTNLTVRAGSALWLMRTV